MLTIFFFDTWRIFIIWHRKMPTNLTYRKSCNSIFTQTNQTSHFQNNLISHSWVNHSVCVLTCALSSYTLKHSHILHPQKKPFDDAILKLIVCASTFIFNPFASFLLASSILFNASFLALSFVLLGCITPHIFVCDTRDNSEYHV